MRILITGGSGFIANHITNHSESTENEYLLIGRSDKKFDNTKNIKHLYTDYSYKSLKEIIIKFVPDAVIHSAAQRPLKRGNETSLDYTDNFLISQNLIEVCRAYSVKNIVSLSSISVYGDNHNYPWDENAKLQPISAYGYFKYMVDEFCEYNNKMNNLNIKSLRIGQVFGLGEIKNFSVPIFIEKAIRNENITVYGEGKNIKDYIYIEDLVNAILTACRATNIRGIFNISNSVPVTTENLAEYIKEVFNPDIKIIYNKNIFEPVNNSLMNTDKARKYLGWFPKYTMKSALEDYRTKIFYK